MNEYIARFKQTIIIAITITVYFNLLLCVTRHLAISKIKGKSSLLYSSEKGRNAMQARNKLHCLVKFLFLVKNSLFIRT